MLQVIKSTLLLLCSIMGMMLVATTPYTTAGFVLAFGCFLLFALDVASNFIN